MDAINQQFLADIENTIVVKRNLELLSDSCRPAAEYCYQAIIGCVNSYEASNDTRKFDDSFKTHLLDRGLDSETDPYDYYDELKRSGDSSFPEIEKAVTSAGRNFCVQRIGMRIARDFLFGIGDLHRGRVSACTGLLRTQIEATSLLQLVQDDPMIAVEWIQSGDHERGKRFHKNYHSKVVEGIKKLDLHGIYQHANAMHHHVRLPGVALGTVAAEASACSDLVFSYQEYSSIQDLHRFFMMFMGVHVDTLRVFVSIVLDKNLSDTARSDISKFDSALKYVRDGFTRKYNAE